MAKICNPPLEVGIRPQIKQPFNMVEYMKDEREYVRKVQEYAKASGNCAEAGEVIKFQVADGYAQYVVLTIKPVTLIHLPIGDAWHLQYANRLTAKDVRVEVARAKKFREIFKTAERS